MTSSWFFLSTRNLKKLQHRGISLFVLFNGTYPRIYHTCNSYTSTTVKGPIHILVLRVFFVLSVNFDFDDIVTNIIVWFCSLKFDLLAAIFFNPPICFALPSYVLPDFITVWRKSLMKQRTSWLCAIVSTLQIPMHSPQVRNVRYVQNAFHILIQQMGVHCDGSETVHWLDFQQRILISTVFCIQNILFKNQTSVHIC